MIEGFFGNRQVVQTLEQMARSGRLPHCILLAGPAGVGKATLVRRLAAQLLPEGKLVERDDLSLPDNAALIAEREKWPAEKRNEDPLVFASHPDFLTFPPDGPLRQISIEQVRELRQRAQFAPHKGTRRIFLIDQIDRANEHAANSLLKVLEEPPPYLTLFLTATNAFDLLPTIRSRAVPLYLAPLKREEMQEFAKARGLKDAERRIALADGSPGLAAQLDLEAYDGRRAVMVTLLETAVGLQPFSAWAKQAEALSGWRGEKLENYLLVFYVLVEDLLRLSLQRVQLRNYDLEPQLCRMAELVDFEWLQLALRLADELLDQLRRNIQKAVALDAMLVKLQSEARRVRRQATAVG